MSNGKGSNDSKWGANIEVSKLPGRVAREGESAGFQRRLNYLNQDNDKLRKRQAKIKNKEPKPNPTPPTEESRAERKAKKELWRPTKIDKKAIKKTTVSHKGGLRDRDILYMKGEVNKLIAMYGEDHYLVKEAVKKFASRSFSKKKGW